MTARPNIPQIPDPKPTFEGLQETVRALKQVVEWMLGNATVTVNVQRDTPTEGRTDDLWIRPAVLTGEVASISYLDAQGRWVKVV